MDTGFEGLNDALDIDYDVDTELDDIADKTKEFEKLRNEIALKDKNVDIEDKEYLEFELKTLISDSRRVMDILAQDIKIGTKPRYHEVYATMTKSVLDAMKELREMHQAIAHIKLAKGKLELKRTQGQIGFNGGGPTQVNLQLTGSDLFKMIESAQESSKLKEVKVEFEIETENQKMERLKKKQKALDSAKKLKHA